MIDALILILIANVVVVGIILLIWTLTNPEAEERKDDMRIEDYE